MVGINGTDFSNGTTVWLCMGVRYSLSSDVTNSTYTFNQWLVGQGVLSNNFTATTYLTPSTSTKEGTIEMALYQPGFSWGGYIAGGVQASYVAGSFLLPSTLSQVGGCPGSPENSVSLWIGFGGVEYHQVLWQAGVDINFTCSLGFTISAWTEVAYPWAASSPGCVYYNYHPSQDTTLEIQVGMRSNGTGWASFYDSYSSPTTLSVPSVPLFSFHGSHYTSDGNSTAEWVAEAPFQANWT